MSILKSIVFVILGAAGIVAGGEAVVYGAKILPMVLVVLLI